MNPLRRGAAAGGPGGSSAGHGGAVVPAVRGAASSPDSDKETSMPKQPKKVRLARETLRHLDDPRRPGGPAGTWPASDGPTACCTASCHHIC